MSTNMVNKTTGELVTLANGTRMWIGTKTAHDLAVQQGTMPNNCMVCITDDYPVQEDFSTTQFGLTVSLHKIGSVVYVSVTGKLTTAVSSRLDFTDTVPNSFCRSNNEDVMIPVVFQDSDLCKASFYITHDNKLLIYPFTNYGSLSVGEEPRCFGCYYVE